MFKHVINKMTKKVQLALGVGVLALSSVHSVYSLPFQSPLFVSQPVRPIMMLSMSNDHQLYFKLYDDYSDLEIGGVKDGRVETTYAHGYDYYGYFDSYKCYSYSSGEFVPAANTSDKYCSNGNWSGNFLNWATMTRIDAIRKILYGGYRSTDTAAKTVLERTMLPNDAHAFAKYYDGSDLNKLTPWGNNGGASDPRDRGITICNTTDPSNRNDVSHTTNAPPLMRVASGNYSLWASNEKWQCRWGQGSNGNNPEVTNLFAYGSSPGDSRKLGNGDYVVRVQACVSGLLGEETCGTYLGNYKPTGLLHKWGENEAIHFGLMSGSYGLNKTGGVLRKNVGSIKDEINEDGTFKVPESGNGIIRAINAFRIYGYRFNDGMYSGTGSDNCPFITASFTDGNCSNWGNPQAEIFLESLLYLAGKSATSAVDDSSRISGLTTATWVDPVTEANYCAPLNILQFNASTTSFDADDLGSAVSEMGDGINLASISTLTNLIGQSEGISGSRALVGSTSAGDTRKICTPKLISNLSDVRGTCPEAPRLEGSYQIAGLAYFGRTAFAEATKRENVKTFGVALAPALPKVDVPVPGEDPVTGKKVTILPACQEDRFDPPGSCAIVGFKVYDTEFSSEKNSGKLYVNWESNEHGGDFDQDMWGIIQYEVTQTEVTVKTQVIAQSTGGIHGFGYVILGTNNQDGFKVHSGTNNFTYEPEEGDTFPGCTTTAPNRCTCHANGGTNVCNLDTGREQTYQIGTSSAKVLEQPLYYAAKWGGWSYADEAKTPLTPVEIADTSADTYFYATEPRELEASLDKAFGAIAATTGSASAVATNSTRLGTDTLVYQARFNTSDPNENTVWSGQLLAFPIDAEGNVSSDPTNAKWNTDTTIPSSRNILTYSGGTTVGFSWANLSQDQKDMISAGEGDVIGERRVRWMVGERTYETTAGGMRSRTKLLGDIVNSDPVYSGGSMRFENLPASHGGPEYETYAKAKTRSMIYVGANDGMLHAFDADTGDEVFAYVPTGVYAKLANLTRRDYGLVTNPHQFYVDGSMYVSDAYINGYWKTILVGSLGGGGKGIFALDVTNPSSPTVLFDYSPHSLFSNADDNDALGYVIGTPLIAPMANGKWMAVFPNGYYSSTGRSQLFVIDLSAPTSVTRINTQGGTGLSAPALLPNALGIVEAAYAGDLQGNLWKFDLSKSNAGSWEVAFKQGSTPRPMFVAQDASNNRQPITAAPTLGLNQLKKVGGYSSVMVYVGTGKYFDAGDNIPTGSPVQSFYGVADVGDYFNFTGASRSTVLHEKTFTQSGSTRTVLGDATETKGSPQVDWDNKSGWFIDFVSQGGVVGERVISKALLLYDRLIFPTFIPSNNACDYGGASWLMEMTAVGDRYIGHSILPDDGQYFDDAVMKLSDVIRAGEKVYIPISNLSGALEIEEGVLPASATGRMSWRQLR